MSSNEALRHRALARAVELCGGAKPLADYLGITTPALHAMLAGMVSVREDMFLRVVDLLSARNLSELSERMSASKHRR